MYKKTEQPGLYELSDHLNEDEVLDVVKKINDPRLSADHSEYFIIDMGTFKRHIHKHKHIPQVQSDGHVSNVKVEEVIKNSLQEADELKNRQV